MKKGLKLFACGFLAITAMATHVNAEEASVKIGDKTYATLKDAVDSVGVCAEETCATTTITVLEDHETSGIKIDSGKYITIDLGGYTVTFEAPTVGSTGTETQDMQILAGSEITIQNGNLVSSDTEKSKMFIQNYADLTLKNVEIDATNELNQYALSNNSGVVSIEGTTSIKTNAVAFDVYGWYTYYKNGPQVTVDTTGTIEGTIEVTADNATATKELSLVVKNINHIGEIYIQEGLEENVTIEAGSYTDEEASAKLEESLPEGTEVYEVETEDGETKYVVATDEEVVEEVYETEVLTKEEVEANLKEIEELLKEVAKEELEEEAQAYYELLENFLADVNEALKGKTIASSHDIFYGSFIDGNYVLESDQRELNEAVEVTISIPESLEKVKEGYTRKYTVIRTHETIAEDGTLGYEIAELDAKDNGDGTVTFASDKFSTYILAYEDVQNTTNPNTGDNILVYLVLSVISVAGLMFTGLKVAKKTTN